MIIRQTPPGSASETCRLKRPGAEVRARDIVGDQACHSQPGQARQIILQYPGARPERGVRVFLISTLTAKLRTRTSSFSCGLRRIALTPIFQRHQERLQLCRLQDAGTAPGSGLPGSCAGARRYLPAFPPGLAIMVRSGSGKERPVLRESARPSGVTCCPATPTGSLSTRWQYLLGMEPGDVLRSPGQAGAGNAS
jgi:hypothetical protein